MTDLAYVEHLSRSEYDAIGFIPRPRLERYAEAGQILMEHENDEPAGFLVYGRGWPVMRVYQAVVQYDARRREHGARLVDRLLAEARRRGCHLVCLWCADDLPANDFWQAMGFRCIGTRPGGQRRGRLHRQWIRAVPTDQLALWQVGAEGG